MKDRKQPLGWFLIWLMLYLGTSGQAFASLGLSGILLLWIWKKGLAADVGLQKPRLFWPWLLPLAIVSTGNLWLGWDCAFSWPLFFSLISGAFLEEVLMRGLLLSLLKPKGDALALWGSSAFFAAAHLLNLLSGAPLSDTLLQIFAALGMGLLYGVLRLRTGSIFPAIASHGFINATSLLTGDLWNPWVVGVQTTLALIFAAILWKRAEP